MKLLLVTPIYKDTVYKWTYSSGLVNQTGMIYIDNLEYQITSGMLQSLNLLRMHNPEGYADNVTINPYGPFYYYYHKDHLGNNREVWRAAYSINGTVTPASIVQQTRYYPSGLPWSDGTGASTQPYKYNGKEFVEMHGLDTYDYGARGYYPAMGRFMTMDPLAEKYYSVSPYAYCAGNPVNRIDPTGMEACKSSHTDENGKVIAVYDDGDLGVYKHNGVGAAAKEEVDKNYSSNNTSAGGQWMGVTEYWDEFVDRNHNGELKRNPDGSYIPISNSQILFDQSWDYEIDYMNTYANEFSSLSDLALGSMPNGFYDIKSNYKSGTGKKLNGKFATAESAGNYLAGKNAASRVSFDFYIRLSGALHTGGKFALLNSLLTGKQYGSYPWYGEINYCTRNVIEGWLTNPKANDRAGALQRSRLINLTK